MYTASIISSWASLSFFLFTVRCIAFFISCLAKPSITVFLTKPFTPAPVKTAPAAIGTVAGAVKAAIAVPVRAAVILATAVGPTSPILEVKPRIKPLKVGASANCSHS